MISRRGFIGALAAAGAASMSAPAAETERPAKTMRTPLIDITDIYHPPQDPGDNVDLIAAYALPEVDLRAVIFDVTGRYRRPYINDADHSYDDPAGSRDAGFIPVWQLNSIFGRDVPCAAAPYEAMTSPDDPMRDAPPFQQQGIELMLRVLRDSADPVNIVSFGSARPLAVAFNREPRLLREKVHEVFLCAGGAPPGFVEWNVQLDPHAFVRVLRSGLNVSIYPCATERNAFDMGPHNTFWQMTDFNLIRNVAPPLQRYLAYAFERSTRTDFLAALEDDVPEERIAAIAARPHNVWETDVWMHVANRKLVRHADGRHRIIPAADVSPTDHVIISERIPCTLDVHDDGQFEFTRADAPTPTRIFRRTDPQEHQRALREALPALYATFKK